MADSKLRLVWVKECPQQLQGNEWQMVAEDHCGYGVNASLYHCVREQVSGYVQLCIQPRVIAKGFYVLWSDAAYRLYSDLCPKDRYQEVDMLSNKFYQCEKKKSLCDEPGMLTSDCDDGGTTRDRMCRCDYMKDYVADIYAFSNEQNKTCFSPGTAHGGCTHIPCEKNQVMNKAYRCIDKCKEGYYMPDMSMECVLIPVSSTTASTMEGLNTTTWTVTASVSPEITVMVGTEVQDESDQSVVIRNILTVTISLLNVILILIIPGAILRKRLKKKHSGGMDLRKGHGVRARPFRDLLDLHEYNVQSSVGIVYAEDSKSHFTGTGFLITNYYVVTAFHVVEDIFFHVWLDVLDALKNHDSGIESIEKAKNIKQKEFNKDPILRCLQNITISQVKEKLKEREEKETMSHGASGAPGIIYKRDERTGVVYPTVVCMLIRGHPRFAYRSESWEILSGEDDKEFLKYLIEEGATFKDCSEFISEPTHQLNSSGASSADEDLESAL